MKKFSDFGLSIGGNRNMFQVQQVPISDLMNCEVIVRDYELDVTTSQGSGRCVVKIEFEGKEMKFFSNAEDIKHALRSIPKSELPFTATIRQRRFGVGNTKCTYYFT